MSSWLDSGCRIHSTPWVFQKHEVIRILSQRSVIFSMPPIELYCKFQLELRGKRLRVQR